MNTPMRMAFSPIALWILGSGFCGGAAVASSTSGVVGLSASSYQVNELAGFITVPVQRTGGSTGAASVRYTTLEGTAIYTANYSGLHGVLAWASGDAAPKLITVKIYDSGAVTGSKQFSLKLSNAVGAGLGTASATVTITASSASASTVSMSASSFKVPRANSYLTINVARAGNVGSMAAVNYQTKAGTALYGVDYDGEHGVLTWSAGDASTKSFKIHIDNSTLTGNRVFSVQLFDPSGVTLGSPSTATVTIESPQGSSILSLPNGLTATAGNDLVRLTWTANNSATGYHVKRSTTSGGPYAQIAAPTTAVYSDTTVSDGTRYYYVVSALDAAGESANSAQVSALPSAPVGPSAGTGTWYNVTPAAVDLTDGLDCGNYGTQSAQADTSNPGTVYTEFMCQGIWRSTDYGQTWTGPINTGTNGATVGDCAGGITVSPNATKGGVPTIYEACIRGSAIGFWKSVDGGVNWVNYQITADHQPYQDIYPPVVDPYDPNHLLVAAHEQDYLVESTDGGVTWTNVTLNSGMDENGGTGAIFFINTGNASSTRNTWLWMAQGSGGLYGTWRTADGGTTWTKVDNNEHPHGSSQIYQPDTGGVVFMAGTYSALGNGVLKSTDYGQTWTHVSLTLGETIVTGTPNHLYSMYGYPIGIGGTNDPAFQIGPTGGVGTWTEPGTPNGPAQGTAQFAVLYDGTHYILVGGMWNSGVWRYVEP